MKREPTLSTLCLAFELAAFEELGLDVDRILGLAALTRERIADSRGRVSLEERFRWWDAALAVSGDPALGLRVGATLRAGALGSFEYLLRNTESLEQVLARANEYMRLVDEAGCVELRREGDRATLRVHRKGGYPTAPPEMHSLFSAWHTILRTEWPAATLSAVRFAHPPPSDPAVFTRHFGCSVRFDQEHTEVDFPAEILARGPRSADRNLGRVLEEHARHLLAELPEEDPWLVSARSELRRQIDRGPRARARSRERFE